MKRISIFVILGFLLGPSFSFAAGEAGVCSKSGYTVLTVNGVFTDERDAQKNKDALERFLDSYKGEIVKVDYLHNETHLAGFGDALKAFKQKVEEGVSPDDYDLVEMVKDASAKVTTQKLLLVAHSQGNFYANSFYDYVTLEDTPSSRGLDTSPLKRGRGGVPKESIGVYGVASPSDHVSGNGKYLTSGSDKVISGVVGSMPLYRIMSPNTYIELQDGDDYRGHSFSDVYLKYKGAEIVKDIEWSLDRLKADNLDSRLRGNDSPRGCIDPPKLSLGHKIAGAAFAVADPAANGTRLAVAGTVKGIYTMGLAIGNAGKYVADALIPGKAASLAGAVALSQPTPVVEQSSLRGTATNDQPEQISEDLSGQATTEETPEQISEELDSRLRGNDREEENLTPLRKEEQKPTTPSPSIETEGRREETPVVAVETKKQENPPPPQTATPAQTLPPQSLNGQAPSPQSPNSNVDSSGRAQTTPLTDSSGRALPPQTAVGETNTRTIRRSSSSADATAPNAPVVTGPASGSTSLTTSVTFFGTAEENSIISTDFSASTATATGGNWSLGLMLSQGTTAIQFYATDAAGNRSVATSTSVFVDSQAPDVTLTSSTCDGTLSSAACLVASSTLAFSWSTSASDISHFNVDKNGTFSTTSAASISVTGTDESTYTFKVAAVDTYGNTSATSTQAVEIFTRPVVINEVAWAGTAASAFDEWVELYNRTNRSISLSSLMLYASDLTPYIPLSGTIGAGEYFLIERTDDTTVSTIAADLITAFSGSGGGSGLNNNGESLILALASGGATTTLDTVAVCSGGGTTWCAGNDSSYRTLERYDAAVSGDVTSNWHSHMGEFIYNGKDANGTSIFGGTPKARNSVSYLIAPSGTLSSNRTLTSAGSPYLVNRSGLIVSSGVTLTVNSGVVMKIVSPSEPWLRIQGTINANGTAASPVVFTSFSDDEYGGDMNADGTATTPAAGNWRRILVDTTSTGSSFTNTLVRYGGNTNDVDPIAQKGAVGVDSSTVAFDGLIVEKSNYHGLALSNSNSTVTNSRFSTSTNSTALSTGLYISGGSPSVSSSVFSGNYRGLTVDSASPSVTSNTFTSNSAEAMTHSGVIGGIFNGNSGSDNGYNAILINSGTLTTAGATTTLAVNSLPYLFKGTSTVAGNSTLSFASGVVVKGWNSSGSAYGYIVVSAGATLHSGGTSASDLILTSMHDTSVGGTTASGLSAAAPGQWKGISVEAGGRLLLSGFSMKYAGAGAMEFPPSDSIYKGALKITGSTATSSGSISNATFSDNYQSGLNLDSVSAFNVSNVTFQNHTEENAGTASAVYSANSTASFSNATSFSGNQLDATGSGTNALTCTSCTPASPNTTPANLFSP